MARSGRDVASNNHESGQGLTSTEFLCEVNGVLRGDYFRGRDAYGRPHGHALAK